MRLLDRSVGEYQTELSEMTNDEWRMTKFGSDGRALSSGWVLLMVRG